MATSTLHGHSTKPDTPPCAYPKCGASTTGGILVAPLDQGPIKMYCCELHAAFDLLREAQRQIGAYLGAYSAGAIVGMVRANARGESVLAKARNPMIVWRNPSPPPRA